MSAASMTESAVHLPNPPGAIRRWLAEHPRAVDMTILVCYLIGAVPLSIFDIWTVAFERNIGSISFIGGYIALVVLRVAAGIIALVIRRTAPFVGLIILVVALIGDVGALTLANGIALCFLLYAVPVYRDVKTGWIAYAVATAGSVLAGLFEPLLGDFSVFGATPGPRDIVAGGIATAVWFLVILLIGINFGNRRRYLAAIIDRAHQLARERDQLALLAVAEERSRLAREIHDIVAHSVSVMIALSEGGARAVTSAPDEAAHAMQRSAETGRTALADMRRLLGALQADESAELAPQPSTEDIPALVRGFEEAGLQVSLKNSGVEYPERLQGLALYRVVQEGLTNVLRYAGPGARVDVALTAGVSGIEVLVRDYGRAPGVTGPTTGIGSGRGLAGLAERVRVFDGNIESGQVPGEPGFKLRAYLPNDIRAAQTQEGIQ